MACTYPPHPEEARSAVSKDAERQLQDETRICFRTTTKKSINYKSQLTRGRTARQIGWRAMPKLTGAEERRRDVAAHAQRVVVFERQRGAIGLAAIRVVDPTAAPFHRSGRRQIADDLQTADRTSAQRRVGVAIVDVRAAVGAHRRLLPDDAATELRAAVEELDGPIGVLGQPNALWPFRLGRRRGPREQQDESDHRPHFGLRSRDNLCNRTR